MTSCEGRISVCLLLTSIACALQHQNVALAQPGIATFKPMGVSPGKATEIHFEGTKLAGPLSVWTSFPASVQLPAQDAKKKDDGKATSCTLTLSPNVPIGIGGIVVATGEGASEVMYAMVDDLPTAFDAGKNHGPADAQPITLPVAIEGESDGTLADYYQLTLSRGQQISAEVVAARLGQDFDAVIRLLDDAGHELVLSDDDPATGADARFVFTAPKDGNYLLELRDNRYKPGGRYRLRLGHFPLVSATLPPVLERDALTQLEFRGPEANSWSPINALPISAMAPGGRSSTAINVGVKPSGSDATAWAAPLVTDLPLTGTKLGPGLDKTLDLPRTFYGVLERSGERDVFSFKAAKAKPLRFKAISRSSGSPAIITLRILDTTGKQIAESPVTESDEPVLAFTPPADGAYQLAVDELAGRFGSDFVYAVECQFVPQFTLTLKNDKNNRLKYATPSGGAFYLDVQCQRAGYDGPIALAVESPRTGWQLINAFIPAKTNEVRMYVQPPVDFAPSELATLRIIGKAEQAGHVMTATMSSLAQLRAARPHTPYPPRWHDGLVCVSGQPDKPGFFNVTAKTTAVELPRPAGEALVTLDFERTDPKFKDTPLIVIPVGLPPGVTAEVKRNGNGPQETYEIRLKSTKDAAKGQHLIRYFAYAELAGQGRGVTSGDLVLNISDK